MKILRALATHQRGIAKYGKWYLGAGTAAGLIATRLDGMEPNCPTDWLRYMVLWPAAMPILYIAVRYTYFPPELPPHNFAVAPKDAIG